MRTSSRHVLWLAPLGLAAAFLWSCTIEPALPPGLWDDDDDPKDAGADARDAARSDSGDTDTVVDAAPDAVPTGSYTNPVFAEDFPDPFVLRDGSRYYGFATNSAGKNVRVTTSSDLATWTELPDALPVLPSWAKANASLTWAPSVLRRGSSYVLYFTARDIASGFQCIGRAVATDPAGPYVDDSSAPFICQVTGEQALCGSIDASPFVDENGDAYLLWKSDENANECRGDARLWGQRLGVDGISLLGMPTELLRRSQAWEGPLIEGPSMVKSGGQYFLFYSGNWWGSSSYGIGYAVCTTPVGPCTKTTLDGPLVKSVGDALGPGGQEFFTDPNGKTWMAYHGWTSPLVGYESGGKRSLRIDRVEFAGGVPSVAGPSTTPRPL
jgi:beta-xylosidase